MVGPIVRYGAEDADLCLIESVLGLHDKKLEDRRFFSRFTVIRTVVFEFEIVLLFHV